LVTSDYIGIATIITTILVGAPTLFLVLPQYKEMKRKKRDGISELINNKNWNNIGINRPFDDPTIEIVISSIDVTGLMRGTITNCESSSQDLELCTFSFHGRLNHRGNAIITLCTAIGWREVNVGVAQIKYISNDNSINYNYLHDHKDNTEMSHELSLPRFKSYNLQGC
jgi:hypothetical protein